MTGIQSSKVVAIPKPAKFFSGLKTGLVFAEFFFFGAELLI